MNKRYYIYLLVFAIFSTISLFSAEMSFIFVDKGDLARAREIDPDVQWDKGYGVDCLELDYYNPLVTFYSYKEQVYATDVVGNRVLYSIGDGDSDTYGDDPDEITLSNPHGIAGYRDGSVWVADTGNKRVLKLYCDGYDMSFTGTMITGLHTPRGVEVDADGNVYVTDTGTNRVLKYDPLGNEVASFNTASYINYPFDEPLDIAINSDNEILVVDSTERLLVFSPDGLLVKSTTMTDLRRDYAYLVSVDVDKYNNIYLLDKNTRTVYKLAADLSLIDHFGGAGSGDMQFERPVSSLTVYGRRGGLGVITDYGAKLFRIGPGLHDLHTNPGDFSPATGELTIEYKTTAESSVEVMILNDDDSLIRSITHNEFQYPGPHTLYWNGRDEFGRYADDGTYKVKVIAVTAVDSPFAQETETTFTINHSSAINLLRLVPPVITADDQDATLTYEMTANSKPVIQLAESTGDADSDIMFTLFAPTLELTEGNYYLRFDGTDQAGVDLSDDMYYFSAYSVSPGGAESDRVFYPIGIDRTPIDFGEILHIPASFNPRAGETLHIVFSTTEDCYATFNVIDTNEEIINIKEKTHFESGPNAYHWTGIDRDDTYFTEGVYTLEIILDDITGNSQKVLTRDIYVNTDAPAVTDVYVNPFIFQATEYLPGKTQLYYTLEDGYYDFTGTEPQVTIGLYAEDGTEIKTIQTKTHQLPGSYNYTWDGTGIDGAALVADGAYYFGITADDGVNTAEYKISVIKNNIACAIDSPTQHEKVSSGIVPITGTATNLLGFKYFTLDRAWGEITADAVAHTQWHPITVDPHLRSGLYPENTGVLQVQHGIMAEWDTRHLPEGTYTIKLSVYDRNDQVTHVLRTVTVDNPLYLFDLKTNTGIINPLADDFRDGAHISYGLTKNAKVTVRIFDTKGTTATDDDTQVKMFSIGSKSATFGENRHDFYWDGSALDDGTYRLAFEAVHLLVQKAVESLTISIETTLAQSNTVAITHINTTDVSDRQTGDPVDITPVTGKTFTYRAAFNGTHTTAQKVKLRLSLTGVYKEHTVNVPVKGGPIVYDHAKLYPEDWDGHISIGPFFFTDSKGEPVEYDLAPSSAPGRYVSQLTGLDTVGETTGQLKIFYQNIADSSNTPNSFMGYSIDKKTQNQFGLINVGIDNIRTYYNRFEADLYNEPYTVQFSNAPDFSLGTVAKVWYHVNAPKTYYASLPYSDSIDLIAYTNSNGSGTYELRTMENELITGKTLSQILARPDAIIDYAYNLEVLGITDGTGDTYNDNPDQYSHINAYFDTKGANSKENKTTNLTTDFIRLHSSPALWFSREDDTLNDGYFPGPGYIVRHDQTTDLTITIPYTPPTGVQLSDNGLYVLLLDNDQTPATGFTTRITNARSFTVHAGESTTYDQQVIPLTGRIEPVGLDYYQVSCYNVNNTLMYTRKHEGYFTDAPTGLIDVTGMPEGLYTIALDAFYQDGQVESDWQTIIYNHEYTAVLHAPYMNTPTQEIQASYTVNQDSIVTIQVLDAADNSPVTTIVHDRATAAGTHEVTWNGFDDNDTPSLIDDDHFAGFKPYIIKMISQDADFAGTDHEITIQTRTITLQPGPTTLDLSLSTDVLTPDGNGINDTIILNYTVNKPVSASVTLYHDNQLITPVGSDAKNFAGTHNRIWDGMHNDALIDNGFYRFEVRITPLDGSTPIVKYSDTFELKQAVAASNKIRITYPEDNRVYASTSGTLYSFSARPHGREYPTVAMNYSLSRTGNSGYRILYNNSIDLHYKNKKSNPVTTYHYQTSAEGNEKIKEATIHRTRFTGKGISHQEIIQQNSSTATARIMLLQDPGSFLWGGQFLNWYGYLKVKTYTTHTTDWTVSQEGTLTGISNNEQDLIIKSQLTNNPPVRPNNLGTYNWTNEDAWNTPLNRDSLQLRDITYVTRSGHASTDIDDKVRNNLEIDYHNGTYTVKSNYSVAWHGDQTYGSFNNPLPFVTGEFDPDSTDNAVTVDIYRHLFDATRDNYLAQQLQQQIDIDTWDITLDLPEQTTLADSSVYILGTYDKQGEHGLYLTGETLTQTINNHTVELGRQATINEQGLFKLILDQDKERKFLEIKGTIAPELITGFNGYEVFIAKGDDSSYALWEKIHEQNGLPQLIDDTYLFYNWDVTNLYGPYMILVRADKDTGTEELITRITLGNRIVHGRTQTAKSPYEKAILTFYPLSLQENTSFDDPATPETDVIVDIIPTTPESDAVDENGMKVIGPVFNMKPSGIKFDAPVRLDYRFTNDELTAWAAAENITIDEFATRIGSYHVWTDNTGKTRYDYMTGYIDRENNILSVNITGFSKYALVYDGNEVPQPVLDKPGLFSNTGLITITGETQKDFMIKLYLDDLSRESYKGSVRAHADGSFTFEDLRLNIGENTIYAVAINAKGIASDPVMTAITYDTTRPVLDITSIDNQHFSPDNDGITDTLNITYMMNEAGRVQYQILNTYGTLITSGDILTPGNRVESFTWDGIADTVRRPEGRYTIKFTGYDNAGNMSIENNSSFIYGYLDTSAPQIERLTLDYQFISPDANGFNDKSLITMKMSDTVSDMVRAKLTVRDANNVLIDQLIIENPLQTGITSRVFPPAGKQVYDGTYHITARLYDMAGNSSLPVTKDIHVSTTPPADRDSITLGDRYLSTATSAHGDTVPIYYSLDKTATCYITVYAPDNTIVKKMILENQPGNRSYIEGFDGTDEQGMPLTDGEYRIQVFIIDTYGNHVEKNLFCTIDNTAPVTTITQPQSGQTLGGILTITGTAHDENFDYYLIETKNDLDYAYIEHARFSQPVTAADLFTFDTGIANGTYTMRVTTYDKAGNYSRDMKVITLDNDLNSTILTAGLSGPALIAPDNNDQTKIIYHLEHDVTLDITIEHNGTIIETLAAGQTTQAGRYVLDVTGRDGNNTSYADGTYRYVFTALVQPDLTITKYVEVTIDNTPPQVTITGINNTNGILALTGTVLDTALDYYLVEYGLGETPAAYILLNNGKAGGTDILLGKMDGTLLLDRRYAFKVTARDKAGNTTEAVTTVMIDNKKPTAVITAPAPNSFITTDILAITGTAVDEHIRQYTLAYKQSDESTYTPLTTITNSNVTDNTLGALDVTNLMGHIDIRLTVTDNNGNESTASTSAIIDKAAPVITIESPTANALVGDMIIVRGTITDDYLDRYEVFLDKGINPDETTLVHTGYTPVITGDLCTIKTDGLTGVHTITITAYDQSGRTTVHRIPLTIDTNKPVVTITKPAAGYYNTTLDIEAVISDEHPMTVYTLSYHPKTAPGNITIITSGTLSTETEKTVAISGWDSSTLTGDYYLVLQAVDASGNAAYDRRALTFDNGAPVISEIILSDAIFHPDSPIAQSQLSYTISEDASITYQIMDSNDTPVAGGTLLEDVFYEYGPISLALTGKLTDSTVLADGLYKLRITAQDMSGNAGHKDVSFEILRDVEAPAVKAANGWTDTDAYFSPNGDGVKDIFTLPLDISDNVHKPITATFTIEDQDGEIIKQYETTTGPERREELVWNGVNEETGLLIDGVYTLKYRLTDTLNNVIEATFTTIHVDRAKPEATDFIQTHAAISPNLDGIQDFTLLSYDLSERSQVAFTLTDTQSNDVVVDFTGNAVNNTGHYKYIWDGTHNRGEGTYTYRLHLTDLAGNEGETITGTVIYDVTPPVAVFTPDDFTNTMVYPDNELFANGIIDAAGDVFDSNLTTYTLEYRLLTDTTRHELLTSETMPTSNILASWDTAKLPYKEGRYLLALTARDRAGNVTTDELVVTIDNIKPEISLTIPESPYHNADDGNDYYKGVLTFNGGIFDNYLDHYQLTADDGTDLIVLKHANTNASDGLITRWDTTGLDGTYTIALTATDKAGNTTTIEQPFHIDSQPPVITDFTLSENLISAKDQNGIKDKTASSFKLLETAKITSSIISPNLMYNYKAQGFGILSEYPQQDIDFTLTATGYQSEYPPQTFDYDVEFVSRVDEYEESAVINGYGDFGKILYNPIDDSVWINCNFRLIKFDTNGNELFRYEESTIGDFGINTNDGSVWLTTGDYLMKLDHTGNELLKVQESYNQIEIDQNENTIWARKPNEQILKKYDNNGNLLFEKWMFAIPRSLTVNPVNSNILLTFKDNTYIHEYNSDGYAIKWYKYNVFPGGVTVNAYDNSIWAFNNEINQATKQNANGQIIFTIDLTQTNTYRIVPNHENGHTWIIVNGQTIWEIDLEGNQTEYSINNLSHRSDILMPPLNNRIWVTSDNKVNAINTTTGNISTVQTATHNPRQIAIDEKNGYIWVRSTGELSKYDLMGNKLQTLEEISTPWTPGPMKINPVDSTLWAVERQVNGGLIKFDSEGNELSRFKEFAYISDFAINTNDNTFWAADGNNHRIIKCDGNGKILLTNDNFTNPQSISINLQTGNVWVIEYNSNEIVKVNKNGEILFRKGGFNDPRDLIINEKNNCVWLNNYRANELIKLDLDGNILLRLPNDYYYSDFEINTSANEIWAGNPIIINGKTYRAITKLDSNGNELFKKSGFSSVGAITINKDTNSVWFTEGNYNDHHRIIELKTPRVTTEYFSMTAHAGPDGEHVNDLNQFKNNITYQNGFFRIANDTKAHQAYLPGTKIPHPYIELSVDDKGTPDFHDDVIISRVTPVIPETYNPFIPWQNSMAGHETVTAKEPRILQIPTEYLLDPNGDPTQLSITNVSGGNVELVTKPGGQKELKVTTDIIIRTPYTTPLVESTNFAIGTASDNEHDIYLDTGLRLPADKEITIDRWEIDLYNIIDGGPFTYGYIVDGSVSLNPPAFSVRSTKDDTPELRVFNTYTAGGTNSVIHNPAHDWDGLTTAGNHPPDGGYLYITEVHDKANNRALSTANVVVDNTAPVVAVTSLFTDTGTPIDFTDNIYTPVRIIGDAYDTYKLNRYAVTVLDNGTPLLPQTPVTNPVVNDELLSWDPTGLVGSGTKDVTLNIHAVDEAGNEAHHETVLHVTTIDSIITLKSGKQYISPLHNNTTHRNANITFALSGNADVTVQVYNNSSFTGTPVKTILNAKRLTSNTADYTYHWDGRNTGAGIVSNGTYYIKITAVEPTSGKTTTRSFTVIVDRGITRALITSPEHNRYIDTKKTVPVHVSITEDNAQDYSLFYKKHTEPDANYQSILHVNNVSHVTLDNAKITDIIIPDQDDAYDIKLQVTDLAGNRKTDTVTITRDTIVPTASFTIDAYTGPEHAPLVTGTIAVTASASDTNIHEYRLMLDNNHLAGGTHSITNALIVPQLDTTKYTDGAYTLTLTVTDKNNHSTTVSRTILIDNTGPTVSINSPVSQSFNKGSILIEYLIHDTNAADFALRYKTTGTQKWHTIYNGYGSLTRQTVWDSRGLNGTFDLQLTARDKSGNTASTMITIRLDNTLPAAIISSPYTDALLESMIPIHGTVYDDNFDHAHMSYKKANTDTYIPFAAITDISPESRELGVFTSSELADGKYTIKLTVTDKAGNTNESEIDVHIDNNAPDIVITDPAPDAIVEGIINIMGTITDYTLDHYTVAVSETGEPGTFTTLCNHTSVIDEGIVYSFDSHQAGAIYNGNYIFKITAVDTQNRTSEYLLPVYIDNIAPEIKDITVHYPVYHPHDDNQLLSFKLTEDAKLTVSILDEADTVITDIAVDTDATTGQQTLTWDGKDMSGHYLENGIYTFVITAVDYTGKLSYTYEAAFDYIIDIIPPVIDAISYAQALSPNGDGFFDTAGLSFNVADDVSDIILLTVTIVDSTDTVIHTLIDTQSLPAGLKTLIWDGKNNTGAPIPDGTYYFSIKAVDTSGNDTIYTSDAVILDTGKPVIDDLTVTPVFISPGDAVNGTMTIRAAITDNTPTLLDVAVTILDERYSEIRLLADNTGMEQGIHAFTWDGTDTAGLIVPDNAYMIRMTVRDALNNTAEVLTSCHVDGTPPVAEVVSASQYNTYDPTHDITDSYLTLEGQIFDHNLDGYTISFAGGDTPLPDEWQVFHTAAGNKEAVVIEDSTYYPILGELKVTGMNGRYSIKVEALDKAGFTVTTDMTVDIDTVAPASRLLSEVPLYNDYYSNGSNGFIFKATDTEVEGYASGIDRILYRIITHDTTSDVTADTGEPLQLTEHGPYRITYKAIDNCDNNESLQTTDFFIDTHNPDVTLDAAGIFYSQAGTLYASRDNTYTLSASDNDAGLKNIYYSLDGTTYAGVPSPHSITFNTDGVKTLRYYATDNVDNSSDIAQYTVTADGTAPVMTLTPDSKVIIWQSEYYTSGDTTFMLTTTDALSGVKDVRINVDGQGFIPYHGTPIAFSQEGRHTIEYTAVDNVGNEITQSFTFISPMPDRTPPVTTLTPDGYVYTTNGIHYTTGQTAFILTAVDTTGDEDGYAVGVDYTQYRINDEAWLRYTTPLQLPEGIHRIDYRSVDLIPNEESIKSYTIHIDNTGPNSSDDYPHKNTWVNYEVTITISATDPVSHDVASGVKAVNYTIDGAIHNITGDTATCTISQEEVTAITYHAVDNVDNAGAETTFEVWIDTTYPFIEVYGVANGEKYGTTGVTPEIIITEAHLASHTMTLIKDNGEAQDFLSGTPIMDEGVYTLAITATDLAGNTTNETIIFTIDRTPPPDPENIIYLRNNTSVMFNWDAVTAPDLAGYIIYRDGLRLNEALITDTFYTDTTEPGMHTYRITAIDDVANESDGTEIGVPVDNLITINSPEYNSYYNEYFMLDADIASKKPLLFYIHYAKSTNETTIPTEWTYYACGINFGGYFLIPVHTYFMEDGAYYYRISTKLFDGTTREDITMVNVDNTAPRTQLRIHELDQSVTGAHKKDEPISVYGNATLSFDATDDIVNGVASGVKHVLYKIKIKNNKALKKQQKAHYKNGWNIWKPGDDPLSFTEPGQYDISFRSIDQAEYFGNWEKQQKIVLIIE